MRIPKQEQITITTVNDCIVDYFIEHNEFPPWIELEIKNYWVFISLLEEVDGNVKDGYKYGGFLIKPYNAKK